MQLEVLVMVMHLEVFVMVLQLEVLVMVMLTYSGFHKFHLVFMSKET